MALNGGAKKSFPQEQELRTGQHGSDYSDLSIAWADALWPCLKERDNFLSSYLERTLTYEEDILRAFSGIHGALNGSMSEEFHFGLPQQFFHAGLLWVPNEYLTRRKDVRNGIARAEFPSWSWAGWKGATKSQINAFGLGHLRSNLIMAHMPRFIDIFPYVNWFKIDVETQEKARILNDYARYQENGLEGTVALPPGWSSSRTNLTAHSITGMTKHRPHTLFDIRYPQYAAINLQTSVDGGRS